LDILGGLGSQPRWQPLPLTSSRSLPTLTYDVLEEVDYWVFILGPAVLLLGQGTIVCSSCCVV
jgi:hypothetical protein